MLCRALASTSATAPIWLSSLHLLCCRWQLTLPFIPEVCGQKVRGEGHTIVVPRASLHYRPEQRQSCRLRRCWESRCSQDQCEINVLSQAIHTANIKLLGSRTSFPLDLLCPCFGQTTILEHFLGLSTGLLHLQYLLLGFILWFVYVLDC